MDDQSRYEQEKKVAETYATIGSIMRQTWKTGHLSLFLNQIVTLVDRHFDWQTTAVLVREEDRLAKDLHDSVNQKLFTISLMAQGLADVLDDDSLRTGLADIGELARESLAEMKALIWDLRSAADGRSLPAKIKAYAEKIGLHVQMHASLKEADGLDDRLEEELWRVAQEALNNVRKHAGTDLAAVTLHADGRDISLEIVDRGRGFRAEDHGDASEAGTKAGNRSFGLTSMRERAVRIRGTIRIASQPGQGTTIRLTAPIVQDRKETGLWR